MLLFYRALMKGLKVIYRANLENSEERCKVSSGNIARTNTQTLRDKSAGNFILQCRMVKWYVY